MLVDDLDGGAADETVEFGLDGVTYEIDLSAANAAKLREAFAPYVSEARRSGRRRTGGRSRGGSRGSSGGVSAAEIREWARANGFKVPDRGRVSAQVRQAYESAH